MCYTDDYNRVVLDLQPGIPDSDYVNGSYVDVRHCRRLIKTTTFSNVWNVINTLLFNVHAEYTQTKCLCGDSGTQREDRFRFLASHLAIKCQLYRHAHQDFRLHQSMSTAEVI